MKKILLIDYISYTDNCGNPIGHPIKTIQEYASWVQNDFEVMYAAHPFFLKKLNKRDTIALKYCISEGIEYGSISGKIRQLFLSFSNLRMAFKAKAEYYWLQNIDIFAIFYLLIHPWLLDRVIITTYMKRFTKKSHDWLFRQVASHVKLVICSDSKNVYSGKNKIYIPDYLYSDEIYKDLKSKEKIERAVCLGVMNDDKHIESVVELFKRVKYPLLIEGHFPDSNRFDKVLDKIKEYGNIIVKNRYLDYDEYLRILSESKYVVLPYDYSSYKEKTSGVVLESIFVGAVPISDERLLEKWEINGIDIWDFENAISDRDMVGRIICKNDKIISERYTKEKYIAELISRIQLK